MMERATSDRMLKLKTTEDRSARMSARVQAAILAQ